ncbi:MAG: hydroxymethylbilane synthase [Proteobacteria bacterium]|nr:hydroxymethylbilane synthase [Pseudomonadota bacterium]
MSAKIKIGTRGSPLALAQADETRARLVAAHDGLTEGDIEIIPIKTTGDSIRDRPLLLEGGKGLFTKEIEDLLLAGKIDLAVHSTKDMPAALPGGLILAVFLEREDPRDAFLSLGVASIKDLPKGAVIGTSSLRRQAQALRLRPDLEIVPYRGNVETRIKKMKKGEVAAIFLAAAGLNRLGLGHEITALMSYEEMLPAPGQGAICIEAREGDKETARLLKPLNHEPTELAVRAERAVSLALGASCRMPLAAHASFSDNLVKARAALFSPDGKQAWTVAGKAYGENAEALGSRLGEELLKKADPDLIREFRV